MKTFAHGLKFSAPLIGNLLYWGCLTHWCLPLPDSKPVTTVSMLSSYWSVLHDELHLKLYFLPVSRQCGIYSSSHAKHLILS